MAVNSQPSAIYSDINAKSQAQQQRLLAHVVGQSSPGLQHATVTCSMRNASPGPGKDLLRISFDRPHMVYV